MADAITKPFADQTDAEKKETYREWASKYYNQKYESWVPWMEDQYLKWFGKDNKASYATKGKRISAPFPNLGHQNANTYDRRSQQNQSHRHRSS